MAAAIEPRADYGADDLRRLAKAGRDARQTRRLLALAAIRDGGSRREAARVGGVSVQIVRDWVLRLDAEGPGGLVHRKAPGQPPLLNAEHRAAPAAAVEAGPKPDLDGVVRGRLVDLVQWLRERFGLSVSRQTLGRELRSVGPCQALRPAAAPRGGSPGHRASQERLPDAIAAIRGRRPAGTSAELGWQGLPRT